MEDGKKFVEEMLAEYSGLVVDFAINLVVALAIFIIGKYIAGRVRDALIKVMNMRGFDATLGLFIGKIVYFALLAVVVIAAISQIGIETTSFIAIFGAAGLAIGMALQGTLGNLASGVMLLVFRPFKVGDFVEAGGTAGVVEELGVFATTLKTGDNKTVIVPNGKINGDTITNYSAKATRRVDLVMGIGYDDDIDKARATIQALIDADSRIMKDPAPLIAVAELADSSVNFTVRLWVNSADYWGVTFDMNEAVKKRFDQEGISIPFPQQDVHLYKHD